MTSINLSVFKTIVKESIQRAKDEDLKNKDPKTSIELEVAFGKPGEKFRSGLSYEKYKRALDYFLEKFSSMKQEPIESEDHLIRLDKYISFRKTIINEKKEYMEKTRVWSSLLDNQFGSPFAKEYGVRLALSKEKKILDREKYSPLPYEPGKKRKFGSMDYQDVRKKKRTSFQLGPLFRFDFTEIKTDMYYYYEIEIEINIKATITEKQMNEFFLIFSKMMIAIQNTILIYSVSEKQKTINYISKLLGISQNFTKSEVLPDVRPLKKQDLVYGGLVGGKSAYSATFKTDGLRKLMVFIPTGIWLLMPGSDEYCLISRVPFGMDCVLDGEFIEIKKPLSKIDYYIFDCIMYDGMDLRGKNLDGFLMESKLVGKEIEAIKQLSKESGLLGTRLHFAQKISDSFHRYIEDLNQGIEEDKNKLKFGIATKQFYNFTSPEGFYNVMTKMFLDKINSLSYDTDGIVFTPIDTHYDPLKESYRMEELTMKNTTEKPEKKKRYLTNYNDICKWKFKEKRTVDLMIIWGEGNETCEFYTNRDGTEKFSGSKRNPLSPDQIDFESIRELQIASYEIGEFAWNEEKKKMFGYKYRPDRKFPNKRPYAIENWDDMIDGISQETLTGQSIDLMRSYHNSIKRELFANNLKNNSNSSPKTLLDIGSGAGGDLGKWFGYDKIVCVEPDEKNIEELKRRLKSYPELEKKIKIIQAKGEDYTTITSETNDFIGGEVSTVSMMLSLSFFQNNLEDLITTIDSNLKIGGEFLCLTIDGDLVQSIFAPKLNKNQELVEMDADFKKIREDGKITFCVSKNKEGIVKYNKKSGNIYIDLPGTIVQKQKEHPPIFSQVKSLLPNYQTLLRNTANRERFLSVNEKIITNMYSYFVLKKTEINVEESEMENHFAMEKYDLITLIGGKHKLIHGLLKMYNEEYRKNPNEEFRINMAKNVYVSLFGENPSSSKELSAKELSAKEMIERLSSVFKISIYYDGNTIIDKSFPKILIVSKGFLIIPKASEFDYKNMDYLFRKYYKLYSEINGSRFSERLQTLVKENGYSFEKFGNHILYQVASKLDRPLYSIPLNRLKLAIERNIPRAKEIRNILDLKSSNSDLLNDLIKKMGWKDDSISPSDKIKNPDVYQVVLMLESDINYEDLNVLSFQPQTLFIIQNIDPITKPESDKNLQKKFLEITDTMLDQSREQTQKGRKYNRRMIPSMTIEKLFKDFKNFRLVYSNLMDPSDRYYIRMYVRL